jgi:hypothetical protein
MYGVRVSAGALGRAFSATSVTLGPRSTAAAAQAVKYSHAHCYAKPAGDNNYSNANLKVATYTLGMR